METGKIERVYFIGIGGIGMSAIARWFKSSGTAVAGYDHTCSDLTEKLISEGMDIHFDDNIALIPGSFRNVHRTLVVYTPAIPTSHTELTWFRERNFEVLKRSAVLGKLMKDHKGVAVAGTHGKTTISSMIAHIFTHSGITCNAFLGGIAKNFNSNLVVSPHSDFFVAEADEYDRSFLALFPDYAVVSAMDDDHLDIYGERKNLVAAFTQFVGQIKPSGTLVIKSGVNVKTPENIKVFRYSLEGKCDYYAFSIVPEGLYNHFSIHTPEGEFHCLELGIPGLLNVENAVAAFAVTHQAGINAEMIISALREFKGVWRRFDIRLDTEKCLFIDDYAHHPEELRAFISSVKERLHGRKVTGIFQPHLFTRTRDFADGFAESLSLLDNVILLDIYPAREAPIPGITSGIIHEKLTNPGERILCTKDELLSITENLRPEVLLTMGAGDIDRLVEPLKEQLIRIHL